MMQLEAVVSSNIAEVGHSGENLYVRFKIGQLWRYNVVSTSTYQALLNSRSIGSAFHQLVKTQVPGERVYDE